MCHLILKKQSNFGITTPFGHNRNAQWLRDAKNSGKTWKDKAKSLSPLRMWNIGSEEWKLRKTLGSDGIHRFLYKKLSKLHWRIANELYKILESGTLPEWLIACLPLMWKLRIGIFTEKIYDLLFQIMLLPDEQRVYRKEPRSQKRNCW